MEEKKLRKLSEEELKQVNGGFTQGPEKKQKTVGQGEPVGQGDVNGKLQEKISQNSF